MNYDHDCGIRFVIVREGLNPKDSGVYCRACKKKFVFKRDNIYYSYDKEVSKLIEKQYNIKITILE